MNRWALAAATAALIVSPSAKADSGAGGAKRARQVEVVRKLRIGDNVEDITFVGTGKHKGQVAAMDGWDVLGVKLKTDDDEQDEAEEGELPPGVHKLFDVRGLGLGTAPPRGIEFVPTQKRFYFSGAGALRGQRDRLFVTDENGHALPPLPLTYDTQGNHLSRISTRGVIQPVVFSRPVSLAALPGGQFAYSNPSIFPILEVIAPDGPDLRPPVDPTAVLADAVGQIALDAGRRRSTRPSSAAVSPSSRWAAAGYSQGTRSTTSAATGSRSSTRRAWGSTASTEAR